MRQNEITVIVGRKGQGKSSKARELLAASRRRIVIDPMWEHAKLGVVVRTFRDFVEYVRPRRDSAYGVVLQSLNDGERDALLSFLTHGQPEQAVLPGVTLLIDEVDKMCSAGYMPDGLSRIVNYGRHFGVSLMALSRRPRDMSRSITANADRIIVFRTQEPRDVDYLEQYIGERLAERARRLPAFDPRSGAAPQCVVWPDDIDDSMEPGDNGEQPELFDGNDASGARAPSGVSSDGLPEVDRGALGDVPVAPDAVGAGDAPGVAPGVAESAPETA